MKRTCLISALLLAGCVNPISGVKNAVDKAPDWYSASREEISGRGYPSLKGAPTHVEFAEEAKLLTLSKAEAIAAHKMFLEDPRSEAAVTTAEEMMAWVGEMQLRMMAGGLPPTEQDSALFLDDEAIQRLQSVNAGGTR